MAGKNGGQIVNRGQLAALFGVSLPTVDNWVRAACPVVTRGGRGVEWEFNTADLFEWRRQKAVQDATGEGPSDDAQLDRRKKHADVQRAELDLLKVKGLVAPIAEFERAQAKVFAELQVNILAVPQRMVTQLLGETNETRFKAVLRAELVQALEATATASITLDDEDDADEDPDA